MPLFRRHTRLAVLTLFLILISACAGEAELEFPTPLAQPWPRLPAYNPAATPDPALPRRYPAPLVTLTPTPEPATTPATAIAEKRINILLLGVDERETWKEGPPRTDVIMIASIDLERSKVIVLSVPRDLWVMIPGFGQERINAAYRIAELNEEGSGPQAAAATIEHLLQVPISRYAVVNFKAVRQIIDALGGLEIDVPEEIWDYQFPTEDNQYVTIHFAPGTQVLDGERILQYVRTRHNSNDFGRIRRQQQVLQALRARALRPDFVTKIPGLLLLARETVQTDLSVSEMLSLWSSLRHIGDGDLSFFAIDETLTYPWITSAGADVLLPNEPQIAQLIANLELSGPAAQEAMAQGLQVRLFTDSSSDESFAIAIEILTQAGINVVQGGVASNPCSRTMVIDYAGRGDGANVAQSLGLESIHVFPLPKPPNLPDGVSVDIFLCSAAASSGKN